MEGKVGQLQLDFLPGDEREQVVRAIREINKSDNSLYIGQRVSILNRILRPYGYFTKAIAATDDLLQRTAYGYMYAYDNAVESLPAGAVQALMDRGLVFNANRGRKLGEWTDVIANFPPPESGSKTSYERWVEELIERKPKRLTGYAARKVKKSPDEIMEEVELAIERAYTRLPPQRAVRDRIGYRIVDSVHRRFGLEDTSTKKRSA